MAQKGIVTPVQQAFVRLDRERTKLEKSISAFLTKLDRDPIAALNMRFSYEEGFVTDPFKVQGDLLKGEIQILSREGSHAGAEAFTPLRHEQGACTIEPVGLQLAQYATFVAFRISHDDQHFRPKLTWFKKSDPQASAVFIVDPVNEQYLYPTASSLRGEVVPGVSKTGILAFEPFEKPTDQFQIHFSDVQVESGGARKSSFSFEYSDPGLPESIRQLLEAPSSAEWIAAHLDAGYEKLMKEVRVASSGCSSAGVVFLVVLIAGLVAALAGFVAAIRWALAL